MDRATEYHKRLFLEAWRSLRDRKAGKNVFILSIPDCNFSVFSLKDNLLGIIIHHLKYNKLAL